MAAPNMAASTKAASNMAASSEVGSRHASQTCMYAHAKPHPYSKARLSAKCLGTSLVGSGLYVVSRDNGGSEEDVHGFRCQRRHLPDIFIL